MRRCIIVCANSGWNLANFRGGLIAGLLARGHTVVAAAPADASVARLERMGCRFVAVPVDSKGANPVADLATCASYLRLFARERPDAVLTFTVKPNIYASLAAGPLRIPVINNVSGLGTAFIRDSWLTYASKRLYRAALRRSPAVFFQNGDDRSLFLAEGLLRHGQARLIPGSGVDLRRFGPVAAPARKPGEAVVLMVARLLWDKGVGEYVEAARILARTAPGVRLRLLGFLGVENRTAVPRRTVERWIGENIVDYLGSTEDVRPHIADADCIVLPSYREGTPRSLLEAAAMAKPLIATDVPGCREVVDDGVNGYLCAPRDAIALAAAVAKLTGLPEADRRRMGLASRQLAERRFDERLVAAAYLEALDFVFDNVVRCGPHVAAPARGSRVERV